MPATRAVVVSSRRFETVPALSVVEVNVAVTPVGKPEMERLAVPVALPEDGMVSEWK